MPYSTDCYCSRETLETLAVIVDSLTHLLISPTVAAGDFARGPVAESIAHQRELAKELIQCADHPVDYSPKDGEQLRVDRDTLRMTCYGVLHALRCHEDGKETRFEEPPYDTLITMLVILWELAGLVTEADCDRARTRVQQRAYFRRLPTGVTTVLRESQPRPEWIEISGDYLSDFACELERDARAISRRRVPPVLVSLCFRYVLRLMAGLEEHLVDYCTQPEQFLVRNSRRIKTQAVQEWLDLSWKAIHDQDASMLAQVAREIRGSLE